jgi:hypothetical protein
MPTWSLKRTVQCQKCPWREEVNPHDIPYGYTEDLHRQLEETIAGEFDFRELLESERKPLKIMACHETHNAHCIGWLINQLGPGNNIPLRIAMMSCRNVKHLKLRGEQHPTFWDTLPQS